ncbi:hypothetical protein [Catenuloplanes japonicus]|uniref:hypothetical protein n=1 Tax=Catenuloplanes japonicus TaxID=33876 RepID=UPI0005251BF3|nr:hypothetical protein [Catenuloplanes japonicus]
MLLLGGLGPEAVDALPYVRATMADETGTTATSAATAFHRITGDPGPALDVFDRELTGPDHDCRAALSGYEALGALAADRVPRILKTLRRRDHTGWTRVHAARALWSVAGRADGLPALLTAWRTNAFTRREITQLWTAMGPSAAEARPLLAAEQAAVRRHSTSGSGWHSGAVSDDEELLRLLPTALAAIGR